MRAPSLITAAPRILRGHRRAQLISRLTALDVMSSRRNTTHQAAGAAKTATKSSSLSSSSSSSSSSASNIGKALLLSTITAGLAYTYALSQQGWFNSGPQYGSAKDFQNAIAEIQSKLGEEAIVTDEDDIQEHAYSEWSSINSPVRPVAIAYPQSTEEVSEIARICSRYRMPMVPYSGGSSLEGNFSTLRPGLTVDFRNMDRILALHGEDMDVVVQPAIGWMDLNEKIKDSGLFFPVDPGPSAQIGGMVGTSCSGTNAVRYGTMKDWVINLTVVLADGRIIKTRRRPRKTSAGYNLTGLFVGSEGTLGMVTEATLRLTPIPEQTRVAVFTFPTIRAAAATAEQVTRRGVHVQCMEILDEVQMNVINRAGGTRRTWKEAPSLFFKFSGTAASVADCINVTKDLAKKNKADSFVFARDELEAHDLWAARKQALWSMLSLRKEGTDVWSTDVSVPISRLPEIIGS